MNYGNLGSKLPQVGTTIFSVMSKLAHQHQAINLSQGFPNYDISPKLKTLAQAQIQAGFNQYAPMPGDHALRTALTKKMNLSYDIALDPDTELTITAGATQAIFTAAAAFVRPGDEVIIIEPAYDSYAPSIQVNGGKVVSYTLQYPDYNIDWNEFAQLITASTKMIMINSPHNPTGSILKKTDLEALQNLVRDTDILILSDEVYEHLIYDEALHESVLKYPELRARSLVTFSFGKTFHGTGWKIGYCVAPPPLMAEFKKVHQFNVFCVNHPFQKALALFLENKEEYEALPAFYQAKRDFLKDQLKNSRLRPLPCAGTYFQLYDYSAISDEPDLTFAKRITKEFGVASIPLSPFYEKGSTGKVIRLCFAKTEEVLAEAGKRLCKL